MADAAAEHRQEHPLPLHGLQQVVALANPVTYRAKVAKLIITTNLENQIPPLMKKSF